MADTSTPLQQFDLAPVAHRLLEQGYRLLAALPLLLLSVLVIGVAWRVGGWISRRALLDRISSHNPFLQDLARTTTRWLVLLVGILIALEIMNATALVGAVLGTAGVLGVALGFAFKEILENYLAGILMSTRQPFQPRDHVVIDGNEGVIVSLTSRATILMTLDGNHVRLPNAMVFRSVILNYTRNPKRRFTVDVGVGVNEDLVLTKQAGVDELCKLSGVLDKPPPRALIIALGDSNVQVKFHGWVDQRENDFLRVRSEAIRRVKLALAAAGVDMPEPIYRVQLSQPATANLAAPVRDHSTVEATDTSAISDISNQIEAEQSQHADSNLLDANAPRE
ncbi:MAG: mechanosensitive ion channel family protein [Lysobacteraceae bacterium]